MLLFKVVLLLYVYHYHWRSTEQRREGVIKIKQCRLPELPTVNDDIGSYLAHQVEPTIKCDARDVDWVCVERESARLCNKSEAASAVVCEYAFLDAAGGGATITAHGTERVDLRTDAFRVECRDSANKTDAAWKGVMAGIAKRPRPVPVERGSPTLALSSSPSPPRSKNKEPGRALNISVLLWDVGSLSRPTFERKLPQTYGYLKEELRAFFFTGYTSLDHGDQDPLMAILTGEMPSSNDTKPVKDPRHAAPFLWETFAERGYVTAFAEDGAVSWARPPRSTVYDDRPPHHHLGPYYKELVKELNTHSPYCVGRVPRHKVPMDWTLDFFDTYPNVPKLAVVAHRELTVDKIVEVADDDLTDFLKALQDKKHLSTTVLIVLSDSGPKSGSLGKMQQARAEEQSPFLAIVAPLLFDLEYPDAMISLVENANRLVTQLDIHATLTSILHFVENRHGQRNEPAISLFDKIPAYRTCADAQIPEHRCTCLEHFWVSITDPRVNLGSLELIDYVNYLTDPYRLTCKEFILEGIEWAQIAIPNKQLVPVADKELYKVRIHVQPGNRKYVADFTYDVTREQFHFDVTKIHRVDNNYDQLECVFSVEEQLSEICYCPLRKV